MTSTPGRWRTIGGTGVFVTAVRTALLDGRVDVACTRSRTCRPHPRPGIALAAVPQREDPSDALCARDGLTLASPARPGRVVGTGSPRRVAQLLALRPDLQVVPIRGNVDTRLRMVTDGRLDAVVLAARRTGPARPSATRSPNCSTRDVMLPAPAQGALAVECRAADARPPGTAMLSQRSTTGRRRAAVTAERSVLAALEAGCIAPVGAHAAFADGEIALTGAVVAVDGGAAGPALAVRASR